MRKPYPALGTTLRNANFYPMSLSGSQNPYSRKGNWFSNAVDPGDSVMILEVVALRG